MSPRILGLSLVVGLALVLSPASWAAGGWDVGLTGGIGVPTGDFKDKDKLDGRTGPQAGMEICYHASETVAVGVDASWNRNKHGAEGEVEDLGGGTTLTANKDRFQTLQFGVHGKYLIPASGPIKPYGLLGVGIYSLKEDYEYTYDDGVTQTVFTDESDETDGSFEQPGSRVGFKIGLGATYMTSPTLGLGIGVDYNSISMDKDKFEVSTVPYISVRGKVTYHIMPK